MQIFGGYLDLQEAPEEDVRLQALLLQTRRDLENEQYEKERREQARLEARMKMAQQ